MLSVPPGHIGWLYDGVAAGNGFTVTSARYKDSKNEYEIVAVPPLTPGMTPEELTDATAALLLFHDPRPNSVKAPLIRQGLVAVVPWHMTTSEQYVVCASALNIIRQKVIRRMTVF